MTSVPDDRERRSAGPSFADVMNGFSVDGNRGHRRRRRAHRQEEPEPEPEYYQAEPEYYQPGLDPLDAPAGTHLATADEDHRYAVDGSASAAVRPYAWTMGRTKSQYHLEIETLVSTSSRGRDQLALLSFEYRSVADLCARPRSVAEVAALLEVPLGVAKVLLGDMAGLDLVIVHQTVSGNGNVPALALMERVLSGLRRL
ncbi:hypothetical protein GCM10023321_13110 [Pseudonocardia eucalypti]|uniref:DUF742 domain-containing protein n=1 Tax=Pseudonocardia eucalypti TaxID=648755 RepID=A0ABP9PN46_9PSEU|nr:hypothetical protein [Pseudonocardia eucalypti]